MTRTAIASRQHAISLARAPIGVRSNPAGPAYPLVAWLALIGLILPPPELHIIAGANFTGGRLCVILLFFPALYMFLQKGRKVLLSDLFALATAAWIIATSIYVSGLASLGSAAAAEALEFIGAYLIARAFFWEPAAQSTFIRVLGVLTITVVVLAIADSISGRWIVHNALAALVQVTPPGALYRENMIRATSTFDHPILLGAFCSIVIPIFLYSEQKALRRMIYVSFCLVGSILTLSSAALISSAIAIGAYIYDGMMKKLPWRWAAFWGVILAFFVALFLMSNRPFGWLISHLTLDPHTGYYRILIWDLALAQIEQAPWAGAAFNAFKSEILNTTVDSVWLVLALRFGVPAVIFLILTNVAAVWPTKKPKNNSEDLHLIRMCRAFTMVLVLFLFIGLTVHFWNYMWIFWGLCIGIRASLRERSIGLQLRTLSASRV
jgi:hypothetical protein